MFLGSKAKYNKRTLPIIAQVVPLAKMGILGIIENEPDMTGAVKVAFLETH